MSYSSPGCWILKLAGNRFASKPARHVPCTDRRTYAFCVILNRAVGVASAVEGNYTREKTLCASLVPFNWYAQPAKRAVDRDTRQLSA